MTSLPYGSWPSPLTSEALVGQVVSLSHVAVDGEGAVWWSEGRPSEGGRQVVVREGVDMLGPGFSARSRVHEYGGASYAVHGGALFFANFADQRLYRHDTPLTAEGAGRYADLVVSPDGRTVICVRERHTGGDVINDAHGSAVNDIVAIPAEGGGEPVVLAGGHDFYAAPRLSPDGGWLAWLCWDHPNMPWDGTELWIAAADGSGAGRVAGGRDESISQPRWSPDGRLHWISDRTGWWNLYAGDSEPVAPMEAEFSGPDWVFGQSTYTFLADGRLVAAWTSNGLAHLGVVADGALREIATPFTTIASVQALGGGEIVAIAASGRAPAAVVAIAIGDGSATSEHRVIRSSAATDAPAGAISEARPITFPTTGGLAAHAFYYAPRLEGFEGPSGARPPLLLRSHGGPTASASPALNLEIQFWTSRGFAVVDVDYGGSAGYGRAYRQRLHGQWGIVDLDDCVNAARHLAAAGEVDPGRMVVRGGSAGGYTTLCALTFRDAFAAGASYYGVSDLATLAADTHKFESRYTDRLLGRWPQDEDVYRARSPIHHAEGITAPVILLQGLEDAVVPPSQAEVLIDALRRNGTPFAYLAFAGEQHGFRQAATIRRAIEAELWFYGEVLGFTPADTLEPVTIEGWPPSRTH